MVRTLPAALLSGLMLAALPAAGAAAKSLTLTLSGVKNDKGTIYVEVFESKNAMDNDQPMATKRVPARQGELTVTFNGLKAGARYAVQLYHDANANTKFDTNVVGMPQEGYGLSTDFRPKFSRPGFGDIAFIFGEQGGQRGIEMQY